MAPHSADGPPRRSSRTGPAPVELTIDYRPQDSTDAPRVAVVAGPGTPVTSEVAALLRRRLLVLSSLFAGLLGIVAAIILGGALLGAQAFLNGVLAYGIVMLVACAAASFLAVLLRRRIDWTLGQLRVIELLLFGSLTVCLLLRSFYLLWRTDALTHAADLISQNQPALAYRLVTSLNHEVYMPWALLIVSYSIFIPNRWRRCALVVGIMALAPLALRTAAYVMSGLPLDDWLNLAGTNGGFLLALSVAIAIYGAHRIEGLHREALQARKLGQYQLKERLGSGGMGEVYLAEHLLLRRACALKLIHPDRAGDAQHLRRFEREVKTTASLTHPNTVQVYDYGHTHDGTFYYVMEYLPGLTLEQLVERHGPLPANRAIHFLRQVCGALREAHAVGLIHRDIKPGNVMVCDRGGRHDTAKLLDFGLVTPLGGNPGDNKLTQDGAITGTPAYMSPEQASGQDEVDARSDIYSVGALAYFLLTGQPPFAGRSGVKMLAAHMYEPPPPLAGRCPGVPAELEAVIMKCLAKVPGNRYADVRSLDAALGECNTIRPWTEEDAAEWWQHSDESETRTAPSQGREDAG